MFEKVNPSHPDKVADRIAGALVDYAYEQQENPKIAVEVLIGHSKAHIIAETSVNIPLGIVNSIVRRISGLNDIETDYVEVPQDVHLAANQDGKIRCGDNGIFKGVPVNRTEDKLSAIVGRVYAQYPTDGKYILDDETGTFIACQSNLDGKGCNLINELATSIGNCSNVIINPLGDWTGGVNVDSGATNRKLGSDMGRAVTGGGLHGKDLSKADIAVNIYAHLKAQTSGKEVNLCCAIGDETVDGKPYGEIVEIARQYIKELGGFEKLAEWGLI